MSAQPRRKLSATVIRLGVVSLLTDMASELIVPLMPLFLTGTLGATNAFVGLVDGTADTVSSFSKLLAGRFSDRKSERKPLVLAGYSIAALARPFIALATAPWHVLAVRITDRIGKGIRTAPRDAWIAAESTKEDRARSYGFHRAMDNAGNCLGPLLGLILYKGFGLSIRWVFACAAIPGALSLIVLFLTPEQSTDVAAPAIAPTLKKDVPIPATLKWFFIVLFLFTLANASDAFIILQAKASGASETQILSIWIAFAGLRALLSTPGAMVSDYLGRRTTLAIGWFTFALAFFAFAFASSVWIIAGVLILYAAHYGLTEGTERALVADMAPTRARGFAFGIFHGTVGLGALPASLLFGAIADAQSLRVAFLVSGSIAACAAVLLLFVVRISKRAKHSQQRAV